MLPPSLLLPAVRRRCRCRCWPARHGVGQCCGPYRASVRAHGACCSLSGCAERKSHVAHGTAGPRKRDGCD